MKNSPKDEPQKIKKKNLEKFFQKICFEIFFYFFFENILPLEFFDVRSGSFKSNTKHSLLL